MKVQQPNKFSNRKIERAMAYMDYLRTNAIYQRITLRDLSNVLHYLAHEGTERKEFSDVWRGAK